MGPSKIFDQQVQHFLSLLHMQDERAGLGRYTKDHSRRSFPLAHLTSPDRQAPGMGGSPWTRDFNFGALSGARGRRGRCCFVHSAVGCRSLSLPPPSQPGWRAWCLEPLLAGGAVHGGQGRWPGLSQRLSHCAGFTPGRLPLVLLLAEHLVCGETGSPGGFTTH